MSRTRGGRHKIVNSVDTNASAMAESTISIGQLSRFPEPPSTPNSSSSSASGVSPAPFPIVPIRPLVPRRLPNPPVSFTRYVDPSHSLTQPGNGSAIPSSSKASALTNLASSNIISASDWHDGASSIGIDGGNDRLLPTSFITALLQENHVNRVSDATSIALSGVSETTYPPVAYRSSETQVPSPLPSSRLIGAFLPPAPSAPPSSYRNKLAGSGGNTIDNGVAPRRFSANHLRAASETTMQSSLLESNTLESGDRLLQKIYASYESDNTDLEEFGSRPDFLDHDPMASLQRRPLPPNSEGGLAHRTSGRSSKSTKSFLSNLSGRFSPRRVFVRKAKPLPPAPIIPSIPLDKQRAYQDLEMSSPLPDLINRAGVLRTMLENGQRPHSSAGSFRVVSPRSIHHSGSPTGEVKHEAQMYSRNSPNVPNSPWYQKFQQANPLRKYRKSLIIVVGIVILATIGLTVGLLVGRRKHDQHKCSQNMVGSACNINANCICTSTGQCNGLAQNVVDLLPLVNGVFKANYTAASAYSSFWLMVGGSQGSSCASQAVLLDVGTGLDQLTFPNRTQWAQAALLWNALQTQDSVAALKLQNFVQSLPWKLLKTSDGPVNDAELTSFSISASGYTFNFAAQRVTQPPGSFVTLGQPPTAQIQRVSQNAMAALDRMYTFAQASSNQRQTALQKYWTSVLLQRADTLPIFKAALSVSAVMLPFNASSRTLRNLYPTSTSSPFPPPLSCYPNLDPSLQQQANVLESTVYGLPGISNQTAFNQSCFRDRPLYGVLNMLNMRLPFRDDITGVAQQAAVLGRGAQSRIVLSVGKGYSGTFRGTVDLAPSQLDPRQHGTVGFSDHVILQYLSSISDLNVANALIKFVLGSTTTQPVPPDPSSILYQALKTLPVIEAALFGDIAPSDFSSTVSPFTTASGALFFGSEDGTAFRNWTIGTAHIPVIWTQNATSPLVVHDSSLGDTPITQTWNAIALALSRRTPNIGLVNITTTLTGTRSFSPW